MQALVFDGPGRLVLRSIPRPLPGEGEVLVRIHTAAICGSDLRIVAGTKTRDVRVGHPIGHEGAGTVAAVGAGVREYQPGDDIRAIARMNRRLERLGEELDGGDRKKRSIRADRDRPITGTRLLREAGTDLVTVAALMGHASIATTQIYTQPGEADMIRAVDRLE